MKGWRDEAACVGFPTDWWFPDGNEGLHPEAAALCAGCTVQQECLAHAMRLPERHGHWGGLSMRERQRLRDAERRRRKEGVA